MCALGHQKPQPAKKEKKKKEDKKEDDGSRDLGMPVEEKKAPHPLAVMDKEAKSPFVGDTWKKVGCRSILLGVTHCWLHSQP